MGRDALADLLVELEFNALGKRLLGDDFVAGRGFETSGGSGEALVAQLMGIEDVEHDYQFVAIGDKAAVKPLIELFDDENGAVRQEAVRALGLIGVDAVKPLLDNLKNPSAVFQKCVVQSLKEIRDPAVSDALQTLAADMAIPAALRWEAKLAVNRLREQPQR